MDPAEAALVLREMQGGRGAPMGVRAAQNAMMSAPQAAPPMTPGPSGMSQADFSGYARNPQAELRAQMQKAAILRARAAEEAQQRQMLAAGVPPGP